MSHVYGVLGTLDLCILWSGMIYAKCLLDSYPGRSYPTIGRLQC